MRAYKSENRELGPKLMNNGGRQRLKVKQKDSQPALLGCRRVFESMQSGRVAVCKAESGERRERGEIECDLLGMKRREKGKIHDISSFPPFIKQLSHVLVDKQNKTTNNATFSIV